MAIGQERIIVAVKPGMFKLLQDRSASALDPHHCSAYQLADSSLHGRNFSLIVNPKRTIDVISSKAPSCRGNIQLTVARFDLPEGGSGEFADIDFDDHYDFAAHASDVVQHLVLRTGTNPMLIFEYLKARDPHAELGYTLEPKSSGRLLIRR
jgi:hypothetical protein